MPAPFIYIISRSVPYLRTHKDNCLANVRALPLAYGSFLLVLALFKAREFWKLRGYNGSQLVLVLIEDQALYYLLYGPSLNCRPLLIMFLSTIVVSTLAILNNTLDSATLIVDTTLDSLGSTTLLCILGSRMFFNVKEAAEHEVNVGTNWSSYSHSAIQFEGGKTHIPFVKPFICLKCTR